MDGFGDAGLMSRQKYACHRASYRGSANGSEAECEQESVKKEMGRPSL